MLDIISTKPRRGYICIALDKASPERCGRGIVLITRQTTVPEVLNSQAADVQPLPGWVVGMDSVDPVTAPLGGMLCHGLTTLSPSGTSILRNLN